MTLNKADPHVNFELKTENDVPSISHPGNPKGIGFDITDCNGTTVLIDFQDWNATGPMSVLTMNDGSTICVIYDNEDEGRSPNAYVAIHETEEGVRLYKFRNKDKQEFASNLQHYANDYEEMLENAEKAKATLHIDLSVTGGTMPNPIRSLLVKLVDDDDNATLVIISWKDEGSVIVPVNSANGIRASQKNHASGLRFLACPGNAERKPIVPDADGLLYGEILSVGTDSSNCDADTGTIEITGCLLELNDKIIPLVKDRPYVIEWKNRKEFVSHGSKFDL